MVKNRCIPVQYLWKKLFQFEIQAVLIVLYYNTSRVKGHHAGVNALQTRPVIHLISLAIKWLSETKRVETVSVLLALQPCMDRLHSDPVLEYFRAWRVPSTGAKYATVIAANEINLTLSLTWSKSFVACSVWKGRINHNNGAYCSERYFI